MIGFLQTQNIPRNPYETDQTRSYSISIEELCPASGQELMANSRYYIGPFRTCHLFSA